MLKLLIKLAIAALLANASWRLGSAYLNFYRFKDAVTEAAQFGGDKTDAELQQRVSDLALQYDIPIADGEFSVRRNDRNHTYISGSYTQPVDLLPGYRYPWPFSWDIDVFTLRTPPIARPR